MAELTHLERRRIQMEYVIPLIRDLQELLGKDAVNSALAERARRLEQSASCEKPVDFALMPEMAKVYAEGNALEYEVIASDADRFDIDVHHCRYAEMIDELGGRDVGHLLLCNLDFAEARRLGMRLERTRTRMQGASVCDFRYRPIGKD